MYETLSRRAVAAAAMLTFVAGCSGNSSSVTPAGFSGVTPSSRQPLAGTRILPGPAVSGPIVVPLVPHRGHLVKGWPDKKKRPQVLFVADISNSDVQMYDARATNPSPEGSITTGISNPAGLAVDRPGTLYVANLGNSTVTEYPKGSTSPSVTLSTGISGPYGIAVDSKGDVFVSNLNNNTVVGFQPGASSPYESIDFSNLGQPVGVATDGNDNVWVACDTTSSVYEVPAGSSTPQNAGLSGLNGTIGISFGRADIMYISNFGGNNVGVYAYGTTTPSFTITNGINGPTLNGFHSQRFFQSNQGVDVVGYKKLQTSPFSTITGLSNPLGIASIRLVNKTK